MTNWQLISRAAVLVVSALVLLLGMAHATEQVPGQKPMLVIDDAFQFNPGAWADYQMYDKAKQESYRMKFATLTRESRQGRPHIWMEIDIAMPDQPRVVTRILAEETKAGPGDPQEVIVQMDGHKPFTVPQSFLKDDDQEVGQIQGYGNVKKLENRHLTVNGRSFSVWHIQAEADDGTEMTAEVSEELPPLGIFKAETPEMTMTLLDWGMGAQTAIQGTPMNFWMWIIDQIGSALSNSN